VTALETEPEARDTSRVIAFSDAVIAIAITILALGLPVPAGQDLTSGQILHSLRADWPDYFAFLVSFVVIGNQWATHRRVFRWVARLTGRAGRLNMLWLLMMVLTPFAARLLAGSGMLGVRFAIYTLIQVIATACMMLINREASRGDMLRPDAPGSARRPDSVPGVHPGGIRHTVGLRAVGRGPGDLPRDTPGDGTRRMLQNRRSHVDSNNACACRHVRWRGLGHGRRSGRRRWSRGDRGPSRPVRQPGFLP
jgi:uncharacterized membrane protein